MELDGEIAYSSQSNILEAIALFLAANQMKQLRESHGSSGIKVVIFAAGNCHYYVEQYFYEMFLQTSRNIFLKFYYFSFNFNLNQKNLIFRMIKYNYFEEKYQNEKQVGN